MEESPPPAEKSIPKRRVRDFADAFGLKMDCWQITFVALAQLSAHAEHHNARLAYFFAMCSVFAGICLTFFATPA